ncbi:DUF1906 domain-containing protein [Siminovitchia acidinfaciens]|uniref:DUF1906 domain-containing protein n=1 Tax=Siminovitchia acidinfaciens TaxID=2321395 RepID=UPI0013E00C4D|nr:DUF1906 domain-containing protein [Siminovitchia acidinfaciens]
MGNSWKTFNTAEAKAVQGAGLKLISIFQKSANYSGYFTESQGVSDGKEAERYARAVGQPEGSAIYFAVDFAAQPIHMRGILNYITGVKKTLKGYKVGLYGSYAVMQAVKGRLITTGKPTHGPAVKLQTSSICTSFIMTLLWPVWLLIVIVLKRAQGIGVVYKLK